MKTTSLHGHRCIEDALRQHGVEGEDAFYVLAYQYVVQYGSTLPGIPERTLSRGDRAQKRVGSDEYLVERLRSLAIFDPRGEELPLWYQHFLGRRFREGSGKFFTPQSVACAMAALFPLRARAVIMDPTCGGGTFLLEASKRCGDMPCELVANDIETSLVDLAQLVLSLGTPKVHNKHFSSSNIYEPNAQLQRWYGKVDCILANPPFSLPIETMTVSSRLFALGYRSSDALFIDVCYDLLRPGGRLICLLPHSIIANQEYKRLREAVEDSWDIMGVIGMPEGVFHLAASTTTRADILIAEKRDPARTARDHGGTVFAFAPTVGIPLSTRTRGQVSNDLDAIVRNVDAQKVLRTWRQNGL